MMAWPPKQDDSIENIERAFRHVFASRFGDDKLRTLDDYYYRSTRGRNESKGLQLLFAAVDRCVGRGERVNERLLRRERDKLAAQVDLDEQTRLELQHAIKESTRNTYYKSRMSPFDAKRFCEAIINGAYKPAAEIYADLSPSQFKLAAKVIAGFYQHD